MDLIYECAANFNKLLDTTYHFVFIHNRHLKSIFLDFQSKDFRHVSGLHYLDDIVIEKDPSKVLPSILNHQLTDKILEKSDKFKKISPGTGSIYERLSEMRFLENYLDKSDFIRIYKIQKFGSHIRADYFIEAKDISRSSTVYIFIRKREENNHYVIVSFFKKHTVFLGPTAYWMLKEKHSDNQILELYRNPSFSYPDVHTSTLK